MSSGTSSDLDEQSSPANYALPAGKTPADIVGIGMGCGTDMRPANATAGGGTGDGVAASGAPWFYFWYKDGTASAGDSTWHYDVPQGKTPADIVGLGITRHGHVYAWYKDGTVSSGTSTRLDYYRAPYRYFLPGNSITN